MKRPRSAGLNAPFHRCMSLRLRSIRQPLIPYRKQRQPCRDEWGRLACRSVVPHENATALGAAGLLVVARVVIVVTLVGIEGIVRS